ncbi:hypothetical protein FRB99_007432 [Tulasnella sp. 403]|nr:hypothetical protein FRB99_007432 [Tulasnella sp. 403]
MFTPRRERPWDVVDFKEVSPVPAYFNDAEIEIVSIHPNDISQTFTFDGPLPISAKLRAKLPKVKSRSSSVTHAGTGNGPSQYFSFLALSRSSSNSSSSSGSSNSSEADEEEYRMRSTMDSGEPFACSPEQTREALIFARNQFLASTELRKLGSNVLFFEGWSVTKFRKGEQYRLQVRYCGRPAKAVFSAPPSPSFPPFMDILGNC